jgi:hypothetical protein
MRKLMCCLMSVLVAVMLIVSSIAVAQAGRCKLPDFASATFSDPTSVDNPYLPLVPGTVFLYEPVPNPDNVQNFVEVLDPQVEQKSITVDGKTIACLVVHDYEIDDGYLVEDTYDWYAQDDDGNVWYCGEDTTAYSYDQNGNIVGEDHTGSWEAGKDAAGLGVDALPGYVMLANPKPGKCYQQEFYPTEAEDKAKVMRLNAKVALENGDSYKHCLETKEWSTLELGAIEQKIYAKGVGLVLNFEHHGKRVRTELISVSP